MPNESNEVWRKRRVYYKSHTSMAEGGPDSLFSPFSCSKDRSFLSCAVGNVMATHTSPNSIHLSPKREREIDGRMIQIAANSSPLEQVEAHLF